MASILLRFPVAGSAEAVYDAIATEEGVSRWWSDKVSGPSGKGSELKVSFPDAPITFDFDVTEDSPTTRVAWRCTAGPPEWIGTDVCFDVEPGDSDGVSVLFTHAGWKTTEESFPFIAYSWAQILPRLKQLAETGKPDPYFKF
jgi:uncharacterized protein YndB with AHSA1/START domain